MIYYALWSDGAGHTGVRMIEKIQKVSNPLTVMAIFAGLAEVAGTMTVRSLDPTVQYTFVWFLMLFPVALVLLFFGTLNFNPRVLYAPSDFKNEENFLSTLGKRQLVDREFDVLTKHVEETTARLLEDARKQLGHINEGQLEKLRAAVEDRVSDLRSAIEDSRSSVEQITFPPALLTHSHTQAQIVEHLHLSGASTVAQLAEATHCDEPWVSKAAEKLRKRGTITVVNENPITYKLDLAKL